MRVYLHYPGRAVILLGSDKGRATTSEEVYYDKTGGDWAWIVTDITPRGGDSE